MTFSLTNESKNALVLANESKVSLDETWDEADYTWDDAGSSTWDLQNIILTKESKNSLSLSNEAKN